MASGVSAATSAYLFSHPDVNYFFTSLEGKNRDQVRTEVENYMNGNPVVKAELTGIRQPLVDLKNRCGDTNGDGIADTVIRVRVGGEPPAQESTGRMVLMVDDDPDVRTSVARGLRHSGFDVRVAATGKEALRLLSNETHDALVLDVQMPELDGVAVVTALRALGNDIPICVLSARDTVNDRIAGLEAGADDYLTKPFDLGELVARLHALLRRSSHSDQSSDTMTVGPLTIDTARRLVFVDGERVDLTKREFDLLAVLAENAGVVLSRQRLLELVWGYDFDVDTNVADVFISYLRRKLEREGLPRVIHTVRGIGYVLRDEASRASSADEQ